MRILRRSLEGRDFSLVRRTFYCIGAQKAGTTWLYRTLSRHTEVHLSRIKEVHYWDAVEEPRRRSHGDLADRMVADLDGASWPARLGRRLRPGLARRAADARRYQRMFREAGGDHHAYQSYLLAEWAGQPVVGDISPGYATMERQGFAAMDAASPDARFVFVLRDPVDRLWSNVRHARSRGFLPGGSDADLEAAFRAWLDDRESAAFRRSDYERTIRELEAAVPAERIAYFFYETLFDGAEIARLAAFLGIGPIRADLGARVNPGSDAGAVPDPALSALAAARFASAYAFAAERFGQALPAAWSRAEAA